MRKENKRKNRESVKKYEFIYRTNSSSSWTNQKRSRSNIKNTGKLEKKCKVQTSLFRQMNLANSFKEVKEVPVWEPLKFLL